jgi:hypothetical protein
LQLCRTETRASWNFARSSGRPPFVEIPDAALGQLRHMPFEDLGFAKIDHHCALRRGMPEVILAQGKSSQILLVRYFWAEVWGGAGSPTSDRSPSGRLGALWLGTSGAMPAPFGASSCAVRHLRLRPPVARGRCRATLETGGVEARERAGGFNRAVLLKSWYEFLGRSSTGSSRSSRQGVWRRPYR